MNLLVHILVEKDLSRRDDSRMSKTLFVTNDFGPRAGGIETFVMGLIERLPKNSVVVYTSRQDATEKYDAAWLQDYGVVVIRDRSKVLLPTPRVAWKLRRVIAKNRPAAVCFGAAAPLGLLAPTLRRAGIKRIVSLTHGHEVWWAKVFPFSLALRRIGSRVDVLTYLGDFTHQAISRALTPQAAKAMVKIAPGIDIDHFAPLSADSPPETLRRDLGLVEKSLIVSVGRLVHRKGQDRLIESLALVRIRIPNVHLLLVGEGPYRKTLEELAKKYRVGDAVTFIGRVQYAQLPAYIRCGDVFAMPSRSRFAGLEVEGLGIVYLEASACGLPVIAGNSGGAPDAVLPGITGLVVDGTKTAEIAAAVIGVLSDPVQAERMGRAGRDWIVDQWSWDYWAARFRTLLAG